MATEALVHALEDVATRLRTDSIRATTAAPKWSFHERRPGRRHRGRPVLLGHALRSRESSSRDLRSLRVEQGPRGPAALCRVGGGRRDPSRGARDPPSARQRSRRASYAAAAVRRRGQRIARSGPRRRDRARAGRASSR